MELEKDLVVDGILGHIGSPYNSSSSTVSDPADGRPSDQPSKTPEPATPKGEVDYKTKVKPKREHSIEENLLNWFSSMSDEDRAVIKEILEKSK